MYADNLSLGERLIARAHVREGLGPMIDTFQKHAPIRKKFDILTAVFGGIAAFQALLVLVAGGFVWPFWLAAAAAIGVVAVMRQARRLICDPYVDTVVRMEGLAAGNLDGPIRYTEHTDCVGRLTKAMAVFRDKALAMQQSDVVLKIVVPELTAALRHLKQGDLTYRIGTTFGETHDVLRDDFNATMTELHELLRRVSEAAGNVHSGASEIRLASDDLSVRTEQQAARLEDGAAAMRDVTAIVEATAQNAAAVGVQIAETNVAATEGGAVVRRAIDAMGEIESSAQEITKIINVIDGIAFQTNLLALTPGWRRRARAMRARASQLSPTKCAPLPSDRRRRPRRSAASSPHPRRASPTARRWWAKPAGCSIGSARGSARSTSGSAKSRSRPRRRPSSWCRSTPRSAKWTR